MDMDLAYKIIVTCWVLVVVLPILGGISFGDAAAVRLEKKYEWIPTLGGGFIFALCICSLIYGLVRIWS